MVSFEWGFVGGVLQLRKADPVAGRLNASHTPAWMVGCIGLMAMFGLVGGRNH